MLPSVKIPKNYPSYTARRVHVAEWVDGEKLPSAATCFNTLKLPEFRTDAEMREKLLYSIQHGKGFGMT